MEGATPSGMTELVSGLTTVFAPDNFFSILAKFVPLLALILPISIGLMFLRKIVKGAGKGKVRF